LLFRRWLTGRSLTVDALLRSSVSLRFVFFDEWVSVQSDSIGPVLMVAWRDCEFCEFCEFSEFCAFCEECNSRSNVLGEHRMEQAELHLKGSIFQSFNHSMATIATVTICDETFHRNDQTPRRIHIEKCEVAPVESSLLKISTSQGIVRAEMQKIGRIEATLPSEF
jgi:hypothetical protein